MITILNLFEEYEVGEQLPVFPVGMTKSQLNIIGLGKRTGKAKIILRYQKLSNSFFDESTINMIL